jgi:tetratricopeptide (TPR) repeat protein
LAVNFANSAHMKSVSKINWYILLLITFVICLKSVREPDLWWMYKTGDWMLTNLQVTYSDPFSFTMEGTNWINVKWLFEVLISIFKNIGGPEMIFVLQGIIAVDIMLLLGKTSSKLVEKQNNIKDGAYWAALVLTGVAALIAMDFRFIGRPEMMSHLFTADFLFLFVLWYHKKDTKWIYALIPLQLLWANLHEGFGTGMVLIAAFLAGNWLEYYWRGNVEKPMNLTWASLLALFVVVLNPRGPEMWLHPFNIFTQLSDNQYTTELYGYKTAEYWQKEAYLNLIFLALALIPFIFNRSFTQKTENIKAVPPGSKKKGEKIVQESPGTFWNFGMGYILVVFMLFYLSLTAYRNIPFFIIAASPLAFLVLNKLLKGIFQKYSLFEKAFPFALTGILMLFYLGIVSNQYQKFTASKDEFGLQVLNGHNPVAASEFIKKNKIEGRCFSDYLVSSYLLWSIPNFKTYIDLRDLDIFPTAFFERYNLLLQDPRIFDEEDKKYNFNYVVLLRRTMEQIPVLYKHLQDSPNYELVFADPVAMVYLKNNEPNKMLIDKYGIGEKLDKDLWQGLEPSKSSALPFIINKIFNPFFKNRGYENIDEYVMAAHIYYNVGATDLGLKYCEKSLAKAENFRAYEIKALINARLYFEATDADKKEFFNSTALDAFSKALQLNSETLESLFGKAVMLMEKQKHGEAIQLLQQAQKIAPQNPAIQQKLGECYDRMKENIGPKEDAK